MCVSCMSEYIHFKYKDNVCVYVSMDQRDCLSLGEGMLGKMPFQRL